MIRQQEIIDDEIFCILIKMLITSFLNHWIHGLTIALHDLKIQENSIIRNSLKIIDSNYNVSHVKFLND